MQILLSMQGDGLSVMRTRLGKLASNGRPLMARALNEGGKAVRPHTVKAETAQTGLPHKTIDRAQQTVGATAATLEFSIRASGGNVRLKHFHPVEGGGGVTARPWGKSTFYAGAFMTSGLPGQRRKVSKLNGHVYKNVAGGKWRGKIKQERSGLYIPKELVTGQTAATFKAQAQHVGSVIMTRIVAAL